MDKVPKEEVIPQVKKEEEVRSDIITEFGFDEEVDKERIDKLVAKQIESDKKLSDAIGQKIKHRTEAEELRKRVIDPPKSEEKETPKNEGMSLKDIRALQDVHDDDVDFVVNWAKTNNKTVSEARKDKDVQYVLNGHTEERKTADATNTGTGRKAASKTSGEDLLQEAMSGGKVPESEDDMKKMIEARFTPKKA